MRAKIVTPLALTGLLAAAGGVITGVFAAPSPTPQGLAAPDGPRVVEVTSQPFADERTVEITLHVAADQDLIAHAAGAVTWTACAPGSPIDSGTVLLRVDERPVLALHTEIPLYRTLGPGARGSDVEALQHELARLGHPVGTDGRYGTATATAVRKLLTTAGVAKPDGTLRPSDVVWMPVQTQVPSACSAIPGQPLADNDPVATVPGALTALTYPVPADLTTGTRTLTLFGQSVELAEATGRIEDPQFLAAVSATRDYAAFRESQDGQKPTASLALTEPFDALKVPPTALLGLDGDRACVEQDGVPVSVTIVGSGLGASLVQPVDPSTTLSHVSVGPAITHTDCSGRAPSTGGTP